MPEPDPITIRAASARDHDTVVEILVEAFARDPIALYVARGFDDTPARTGAFFRADLRNDRGRRGEILLASGGPSADLSGLLLWKPPGARPASGLDELRSALPACGPSAPGAPRRSCATSDPWSASTPPGHTATWRCSASIPRLRAGASAPPSCAMPAPPVTQPAPAPTWRAAPPPTSPYTSATASSSRRKSAPGGRVRPSGSCGASRNQPDAHPPPHAAAGSAARRTPLTQAGIADRYQATISSKQRG